MFDLRRTPVVRVLIPFLGGALAGSLCIYSPVPVTMIAISLAGWLIQWVSFYLCRRIPDFQGLAFSLSSAGLIFWTGMGAGMLYRPVDPCLPAGVRVVVRGNLREGPVERNGRLVYDMDLRMVAGMDSAYGVRTLVKLYMDVPADSSVPAGGETWRFTGRLVVIGNNRNPGEVDYASIMNRKNCWYRFYCDTLPGSNLKLSGLKKRDFSAEKIRSAMSGKWDGPQEAVSLLRAVCLGDRSGLNEEMRQSYSRAGGMHVLAVSGLHVGLIWWILDRALFFVTRLLRKEVYRTVLVTLLIWFYAFVTGFSSPVCRSATMFTFFSLARLAGHRGYPLNALLVSAFLLIMIRPGRILEAGFQLSYLAVLSIVTLQPAIRKLIRVKNPVLIWIWEATSVSLAAQVGTMPVVIYYFHQVPVYALFTNLLAVPVLSCIMTLFVISVPAVAIGAGAGPISHLMVAMGGLMNRLMEFVSGIPGSVIGRLFLNPVCLVMVILALLLGITILNGRSRLPVYLQMLTICMILFLNARNRISLSRSGEFVTAHFTGGTLVTFRQGLAVDHYIWCSDPSKVAYMDRYLSDAWGQRYYEPSVVWVNGSAVLDTTGCGVTIPEMKGSISACCSLGPGMWLAGNRDKKCLVITGGLSKDQAEITDDLQADFCLISDEPPISPVLEAILSSAAGTIIADGSNRKWYTERLSGCSGEIYFTGKQGAYVEPV